MRRLLLATIVLATALAALACNDPYQQSDFELAVAARAYLMCDCVYTMHMEEKWCDLSATQTIPSFVTYRMDDKNQVVESQVGLMWSDRARFTGERFGCSFE